MRKKKTNHFKAFFKKSTLASLIAALLFFLMKVAEPLSQTEAQLPSSDQPIQLYANQVHDDLTELFINTINGAQKSVTLVIYSLLDPYVIQALDTKSKERVSVYIVCDAKASPGISRRLPNAQIVRRAGKGLTHQKILVVDEQTILLGSANLTTDSLKVHGNLVAAINNPALGEILDAKIKSMDEANGSIPLAQTNVQVGPQNVCLWMLPDNQDAAKQVIQLIRSAKKSIRVAMFTWTRTDFTKELIEAAKRGVHVETVLDRYSGKGASAKVVKMLSDSGIFVHLSTGKGLLHHKFAYIDEEILVKGSANWTTSAFKVNDDCFVIINPLTSDQRNKMNQLWEAIVKESDVPTRVKASKTDGELTGI